MSEVLEASETRIMTEKSSALAKFKMKQHIYS